MASPTTLYAILNLTSQATKEEIKDSYLREALLTHPDQNPENVGEATAGFAQLHNAFKTLYDERKRREYDMATFGTSEDPEEVDFYESIPREFARAARREQVDEGRMAGSLGKMGGGLGKLEDGCEKLEESFGRIEETINNLESGIEGMFRNSAAGGSGGGGESPLVSEVIPSVEQEDSSGEIPYEEDDREAVETEIGEAGECSGTDETLIESAAELYRAVRESAPSPEPWAPQIWLK